VQGTTDDPTSADDFKLGLVSANGDTKAITLSAIGDV